MFVTEDMTLVAVLKVQGVESSYMKRANGGVQWVFDGAACEEQIARTLVDYNGNVCTVEPRDFTKKLSLIRKDMYVFLGHEHTPVRR